MEIDLNFSEIVSEAVEMYLSKMITGYNKWMNCGNIVMPTITGRLQKIDFTKEQIQEIEVLSKRVEGLEDAIHSK